jgi:hypothetical protein
MSALPLKADIVHGGGISALCQKRTLCRTSRHVRVMSALPPKADIAGRHLDVR